MLTFSVFFNRSPDLSQLSVIMTEHFTGSRSISSRLRRTHATATKMSMSGYLQRKTFAASVFQESHTHNHRALLSNPWESGIEARSKGDPRERPARSTFIHNATQYPTLLLFHCYFSQRCPSS